MLVVETIGRIRREHFIHGKSIKEIARDLRLSRNTVRKVLRSDEASFSYEGRVQPRPKLGRWKEQLDRLLAANVEAPARERLTLIRLFEELRALGYDGGYDAVRRYARIWSRAHAGQTAEAFVPLSSPQSASPTDHLIPRLAAQQAEILGVNLGRRSPGSGGQNCT